MLATNKYYNFSVYANSVLGTVYKNAKLVSTLDYRKALKEANIELLQRQIYPYLPPGTPADHTKYTYYVFEVNGKEVTLADVWIEQTSIEETSGMNHTLKLNNITSSQLTTIRDQLRLLGISFDIV